MNVDFEKDPGELALYEQTSSKIWPRRDMLRVPGGWIYETVGADGRPATSVFIPYDHESEGPMR